MEAKRLIDRYGIGVNIDLSDNEDMENKLKTLANIDTSGLYKDVDISVFKRDVQYGRFLEILK
jgi:hypothetical protein